MTALADATIIDARREIDGIDDEICALVNRRYVLARRIENARIDARDYEREQAVIGRYAVRVVARTSAVRAMAQTIIDVCRLR